MALVHIFKDAVYAPIVWGPEVLENFEESQFRLIEIPDELYARYSKLLEELAEVQNSLEGYYEKQEEW